MEGLYGVVGADPVAGGLGAEARPVGRLVGMVAAPPVDGLGKGVVLRLGDDEVGVRHGEDGQAAAAAAANSLARAVTAAQSRALSAAGSTRALPAAVA